VALAKNPPPWHPDEVVKRVNVARGRYLATQGRDLSWAELGRPVRWAASTITEIKAGRRPIRVFEVGEIARVLGVSPGWLAFGEGPMWGVTNGVAAIEPGVDSYTTGEDAEAATAREIAEREAQEQAAAARKRAVGEDRGGRASDARVRGSGHGTRAGHRSDR